MSSTRATSRDYVVLRKALASVSLTNKANGSADPPSDMHKIANRFLEEEKNRAEDEVAYQKILDSIPPEENPTMCETGHRDASGNQTGQVCE